MLAKVAEIAREAGQEILRIYRLNDHGVTLKADESVLTLADTAAHAIIVSGLKAISPLPIVSEEDSSLHTANLSGLEFWLVDPLDGTRNFVERNDHFVVSIGLVGPEGPSFGLLYAPVFDEMYVAQRGEGAFLNGLRITNLRTKTNELLAVASGHHASPRAKAFYDAAQISSVQRFGSALKMGRVASGEADLYPRFGPTYEWDIAAGHAILNECGCELLDLQTWQPMVYNKPDFLNHGFVATRANLSAQLKPVFAAAR